MNFELKIFILLNRELPFLTIISIPIEKKLHLRFNLKTEI